MRIIIAIVLVSACSFLLGCASTYAKPAAIAKSLPQTIDQACKFAKETRPQVIEYRNWAITNWDGKVPGTDVPIIPDIQKQLLLKLNAHLDELDKLGVDVCAIDAVLKAAAEGKGVAGDLAGGLKSINWDKVLSAVLKVATTAAQLKAQGAF